MALKKKKANKAPLAKTKLKVKKSLTKKVAKKSAVKKLTAKTQIVKIKKAIVVKKVAKKPTKKLAKKLLTKKTSSKKVVKTALKKNTSTVQIAIRTAIKKKVVAKKAVKKVAPKKQITKSKVVEKTTKKIILKKIALTEKKAPVEKALSKLSKVVPVNGTEKVVKIGVKTKKQLIVAPPLPIIAVSNFPKHKVKTVLISQPKPENEKNPYYDLANKYNLTETFRQFIKIEGLPVKDFRAQRIDILEHKAVILTSRMAVDHYFRMCNEMRVTVPESMKYICINEATAYYLQKYIQYRKRKIFFGHQTIQDLVDVIKKNRDEKFLLPAADVHKEKICEFLDAINIKYTKAVMYRTVSADLSDIKNLNEYDVLTFFTPAGISSLKYNFPNFKQGNTRIACFGASTANALKNAGFRLDIYAPNPKNPSMSGALDEYLKESNKR